MSTHYLKVGDRLPVFTALLDNADGTAADLTGATGVVFRMAALGATTATIETAAEIVDLDNGQVRYQPMAPDVAAPGWYFAEWTVTFSDGREATWPQVDYDIVRIEPRLPSA